ncbi:MAG: LysR family transcriptional regulator, partial [Acidimicrobiales bacterium]|nr:LysR family transcriptional regulator [Acidimicrobiales bacterium]
MRVEDVRYILTVANEANLTRAAEIEHVSVPAMSEAIRRIEKSLGVTMFDRSNRGMRLTAAGRSLQPHLRQLAAATTALETHAHSLGNGTDGVRVGTLFGYGSVALDRIGEIEAGSGSGHGAGRPIEIGIFDWSDPTAGLRSGETELAILIGPTEIDDELNSVVVGEEPRIAVVSRHHDLGTRSSVTLGDLDKAGWLNVRIEDRVWRSFWTADEQRGGPPPPSDRSRVNSPQE